MLPLQIYMKIIHTHTNDTNNERASNKYGVAQLATNARECDMKMCAHGRVRENQTTTKMQKKLST